MCKITCNSCNGTKETTFSVTENGKTSSMQTKCLTCKGEGEIDADELILQQQEEMAWCSCDEPDWDGALFHDDGNGQVYEGGIVCSKHHWTCGNCHKILQVG